MVRIPIRKSHTLLGNRVDMWSGNILAAVETDISVAQVIGQEDDDIWAFRRKEGRAESKEDRY